ncbi:DUF4838 domain-containing protein [Kribbella sp. NBC_00382]|uniref:DUF4838 domain-containing protein n=1 Tax=Kribbella sp. NBC_00382 TaxID=2975967 RepID=UPI002E1B95A6
MVNIDSSPADGDANPAQPGNSWAISRRAVLGAGLGVAAAAAVAPSATAVPRVVLASSQQRLPIVVSPAESGDVTVAVDEVVEHVTAVTGAAPEVVSTDPGRPAIWLGAAARDRFGLPLPSNPAGFVVRASSGSVTVVGGSETGTLYGVYELLERCGVRWLAPGPYGTVLPAGALTVASGNYASAPHFSQRVLQGLPRYGSLPAGSPVDPLEAAVWYRRQRLTGVPYGAHGIPLYPAATKTSNPELFIHENGVVANQVDVTIPEVLDRCEAAIRRTLAADPTAEYINLGPNDGPGFGVTGWDVPGRIDPLYGQLVVTDRYIKFFNLLLDRLADFPDLKLAFYAYSEYMEAPQREKPNPRIVPVFAPIAVDRRKSSADDDGWERRYVLQVIADWQALGVDWMYRGYVGNLADPGLPYSAARQLADELPEYARLGATGGIRLECIGSWGHLGPAFYLAAKLFWDPTANSAAILRDYYRVAYGSAATTVQRYFQLLETTMATAPYTAGSIIEFPESLPDPVMTQLKSLLNHAAGTLAADGNTAAAARLAVIGRVHDFGATTLKSLRAHKIGDNAAAVGSLVQARTQFDATQVDSPAGLRPASKTYLERFLGRAVEQVGAALAAYGPPVVSVPRRWELLVDTGGTGVLPTPQDGRWTTIDTHHTWSAQGLRYLKGQAWYRCTLPATPVSGSPRLILPSVDEIATVWVNGVAAPLITGAGSFLPESFDLGTGWSTTTPNQILVLVTNRVLDELGTGGIYGTAVVLADSTVPWSPPNVTAPTVQKPFDGPSAPAAPHGARPIAADWEAIIDPYGAAGRMALYDPRISSQHFRAYDPARSPLAQGLGRYSEGLVVRAKLKKRPRPGPGGIRLLLAGDPTNLQAWLDSVPLVLTPAAPGWCMAKVPRSAINKSATIAVAQRQLTDIPLAPHWS